VRTRRTSSGLRVGLLAWTTGVLLLSAGLAAAGPGDPDISFGTGGLVLTPAATVANAVFLQPDANIVAAGAAQGSAGLDFAVVRYGPTGLLDISLGGTGIVTTDISGFDDVARAAVLQPNGRIVAAGSSALDADGTGSVFALVRYMANGFLDGSFGTGGKVTTSFSGDDRANALVLQTDGKLVAAGVASNGVTGDFALARFSTGGVLDSGFGTGGKVSTDIGGDDQANAMVLQPDGKLVVAGVTRQGGSGDFALVRYLANGTLDVSFGFGGVVTTDFGGDDAATALVLQPDGKLVAAGVTRQNASGDFALVRYLANGTLDTAFGTGGKVITDFGGDDVASALVLEANADLVEIGSTTAGQAGDFALAAYTSKGVVDGAFGNFGKVTTDFSGGQDQANAGAVQTDGKIVVAGMATVSAASQLAVARYGGGGNPVPPDNGGPPVVPPTTTSTAPPRPTFASVASELDALNAAIAAGVPARPVQTALEGLVGAAKSQVTVAEQALATGAHRRAVVRLDRVVHTLARLRARLRSRKARRQTSANVVTALDGEAEGVQNDVRVLRAII
jgi:uncharacterized delta-60 repeat protein